MSIQNTRSWLDHGHTRQELNRALSAGDLVRLRQGVLLVGEETKYPSDLLRHKIRGTVQTLQPGTYFSHEAAGLLHGLPVRITSDTKVTVTRTRGGHGKSSATLRARAALLEPADVEVLDGLPVTSLQRTVLDLIRVLPFPEAVAVADKGLAQGVDRAGLATAAVGLFRARRAERVIAFANPKSESPWESISRARLALAGLPEPGIQVDLFDAAGVWIARPDFVWEWLKVVGEFDGDVKYTGEFGVSGVEVLKAQVARQQRLQDAGYLVVRWNKRDLETPGLVENRVRGALTGRRWAPPR